jgi:hypothetical protein
MKLILFIVGLLAAAVTADNSCDASFKAYLDSLKNQIVQDSNTGPLENELADDYVNLCHRCFDTAQGGSKCVLPDDQLNADVFGDSGPLRECERCRALATKLRDAYFQSAEETRKCFRNALSDAIRDELQPCIGGRLNEPNFRIPPLPDFDANTFKYKDVVLRGISVRVMSRSRLDACASMNPAKAEKTSSCLDDEYSNIYSKHCSIAKSARSSAVQGGCNSRFNAVRKATCQCMDDKREDWHNKLKQVKDIIDKATSGTQCGLDITAALGVWIGKLENAIKTCMPGKLNTSLSKLFELACGQAVAGNIKKSELATGFRFARYFLDALNDRITVFCDKKCDS